MSLIGYGNCKAYSLEDRFTDGIFVCDIIGEGEVSIGLGVIWDENLQQTVKPRVENLIIPSTVARYNYTTNRTEEYSVVEIMSDGFAECEDLISVEIPSSVTTIRGAAFSDCHSLTEIEIPNTVTTLGGGVFNNCFNLTSVKLPDALKEISNGLFNGCQNLSTLTIPNSVTTIGIAAFMESGLVSIDIPESVTSINERIFAQCNSLISIEIPKSITKIPTAAFSGCKNLKTVILPETITSLEVMPFYDCDNLNTIFCYAVTPPEVKEWPIHAFSNFFANVYVPENSIEDYKKAYEWASFRNYNGIKPILSDDGMVIQPNQAFQLGVIGSDSDVIWRSLDPSVAYVNECGLVVAIGEEGATEIEAEVDGEILICLVIVEEARVYTRESDEVNIVEPYNLVIESIGGNPLMLNVRLEPVGAVTEIKWSSSDETIATIEKGLITLHGDGDVTFSVDTENGIEKTFETDTQSIIEAGIEEILGDTDVMTPITVYDLSGRIILHNATNEQIRNLDKGIYIIKNKKIFVK